MCRHRGVTARREGRTNVGEGGYTKWWVRARFVKGTAVLKILLLLCRPYILLGNRLTQKPCCCIIIGKHSHGGKQTDSRRKRVEGQLQFKFVFQVIKPLMVSSSSLSSTTMCFDGTPRPPSSCFTLIMVSKPKVLDSSQSEYPLWYLATNEERWRKQNKAWDGWQGSAE